MANKDKIAVDSGLNDLLGNIIQNDRNRSGRGLNRSSTDAAPEPIETAERTTTQSDYDNNTILQYDNMTDLQDANESEKTVAPKRNETKTSTSAQSKLQARKAQAMALAKSPTTTVTLRIPHALNEWIDEYVHRSWPLKIKKQEMVVEALLLLYTRRGRVGDEILETETSPDTET